MSEIECEAMGTKCPVCGDLGETFFSTVPLCPCCSEWAREMLDTPPGRLVENLEVGSLMAPLAVITDGLGFGAER